MCGEDVNHIKNVLRYHVGDELQVCDESQKRYFTKIDSISNQEIHLKIERTSKDSSELVKNITLFQGLPKSDKMDTIVQKCTELGVKEFCPIVMERTIVKIDEKNGASKVERWKKITAEAAKQSGRQLIPQVQNIMNLENIIEKLSKYDIVIMPYECEHGLTLKMAIRNIKQNIENIAVIIGPEGGFSENDIERLKILENIRFVSLGKRILRTETAGPATIAMLLYEYEL